MQQIVVLLLSIIALSSATVSQYEFLRTGKEVVFLYDSHVTVRTDQPASYASLYGLKAKVYVQRNQEDSLIIRLTNVVFDIENGPIHLNVTKNVYVPIPTEAETLTLPFMVKYDSKKLVTAVIVDSNDKEWSYNIKKSIASIFQFNSEIMSTLDGKFSHVEYSKEQTVYGLCNITYNVLPHEDHITVIKTADPKKCENNFNLKRNLNFMDVDSNRVYKIYQKDNIPRIEMIEARGDIIFAQFRGTTEMKSLKVHQRFIFDEEVTLKNPLVVNNQLTLRSLKYEDPLSKCRDAPVTGNVDITGGRSIHNNAELVPKFLVWLDQFVNLINGNPLTLTRPDSETFQLLQNLYAVLENFDLSTLESTFASLQEQSENASKESRNIDLFVQLLPHVGTRSSAVLIRNLIRKQKIDESMAVRVLRDLPAHVRCPNEKLLIELEDLLTLGDIGSRVHRASVLAFATLVKRTFLGIDENSVVLDKYIKTFMQKLQSSKDYNIQVLYVHALANIGIESVIYTLAPIITGEMVAERNLRSLTLWAVAPLFQQNPNLMIKYIWPILSDRKLDSSLRTVAYDIYVRTGKPTLNRFMQLYWLMRDEKNERFYNFHYNTLETFSQFKYTPNNENQIIEIARVILRMTRRPIVLYENEGTFVNDFIDQKSGLGGKIDNLYSFGNHLHFRSKVMSRVLGFDNEILSLQVGFARPNGVHLKSKESVSKYFELVIRREGRTVMTYVEDAPKSSTFVYILKDLGLSIQTTEQKKILDIPFLYERIMPTDFGVPIRMYEMLPEIQSIYFNLDPEEKEEMKLDFQIKSMSLYNKGFMVYNPINNLWHGIEENLHLSLQFGFSISVLTKSTADFQIRFDKLSTDTVNGVQLHKENIAVIKGENAQKILLQFNQDSLVRRSIIRGKDYIKNTVVYDKKCNTLGQHIEVKVFDCDRDISRGGLITRFQEMEDNIDDDDNVSLELLRLYLSAMFQNNYGTCGYGVRFTPLETFDHIEFDVSLAGKKRSSEQKSYLLSLGFEIDIQGATKSVQNTNLATYNSKLNVTVSDEQRNIAIKWWIVHNDQVNKEQKLDIDFHYLMKEDTLGLKLILSVGEVDKLGVITFDVKGTRSEEQQHIVKDRKITYDECRTELMSRMYLAPIPVECAVAHSNFNQYSIDVTVNDVENRMVQMFLYHFNVLRHHYSMYAERKSKSDTKETPIHLEVVYPVFREEWDVTIDTPRYTEEYTGIPQYQWSYWDLEDVSLANNFFAISIWDSIERITSMEQCVISKEYVLTLNGNTESKEVKNEWTSYLTNKNSEDTELYNVYVKNVDGHRPLAIQVKVGTDIMEITPQGNEFNVKVNNKEIIPVVGKHMVVPQWNYLMVESPKMIMFSSRMYGLHVIYDGKTIRTMVPPSEADRFDGHCMESETYQKQTEISRAGFISSFVHQ